MSGSLRDFVRFSREEFETALGDALRPHKGENITRLLREQNPGEEYTYIIPVGTDRRVFIRVYSTVSPGSDMSRDYGEDAIRFAILDKKSMKPLIKKQPHVKRIVNWRSNLAARIEKMIEMALEFDQVCHICGATKMPMKRKDGAEFMGCVNWQNHEKFTGSLSDDKRDPTKIKGLHYGDRS